MMSPIFGGIEVGDSIEVSPYEAASEYSCESA